MSDKPWRDPERKRRFQNAMAMQEIEGNPLSAEDVAMFEMFECEG